VWIEFEAGDVERPIWSGAWWGDDQLPKNESGADTKPPLKIWRSEKGMLVAMDDDFPGVASEGVVELLAKVESEQSRIRDALRAAEQVKRTTTESTFKN
jgi:hypothetical protein